MSRRRWTPIEVWGWSVPAECAWFPKRLRETEGRMDAEVIAQALSHSRSFRLAVDVGAHIGTWSRPLAQVFKRVEAFEPNPDLREFWRVNCGEFTNICLHPEALSRVPGTMRLGYSEGDNSGQGHEVVEGGTACAVLTLDSFGWGDLDLLKVDTEGSDLYVLEGGKDTIQRCRPVVVFEENICSKRYHGIEIGAARAFMEELDYKVLGKFGCDVVVVPTE